MDTNNDKQIAKLTAELNKLQKQLGQVNRQVIVLTKENRHLKNRVHAHDNAIASLNRTIQQLLRQ